MLSCSDNAVKEAATLKAYLETAQTEEQFASIRLPTYTAFPAAATDLEHLTRFRDLLRLHRVSRRGVIYNAVIISAYGMVESFSEELIVSYLKALNRIYPSYDQIPEPIRSLHLTKTLGLINHPRAAGMGAVATPEYLIKNLDTCLSGNGPYTLNIDAFRPHSSNFRKESLDQYFQQVGLPSICNSALMVGPFSSTVRQQLGLGERDRLDSNSAFEHLNDLAERRNLVAHGQVADRLSLNLLKDLVQYVSDLCISIEQAVSGAILQHLMEYQSKSTIEPLQVINSEIACIRLQSRESVSVGDYLVSVRENGSGPYEASEITSIQIDSQSCKCVSGFLDLDIGLKAKHRIKSNHRLAVIPEGEISGLI